MDTLPYGLEMNKPTSSITLAHGSGGQLSRELIERLFLRYFHNEALDELNDAATVTVPSTQIALTTDSFVVSPLFFPGGDIGRLAVCGTVNDLAVTGAQPRYLSVGFIIEEGVSLEILERIVASMAETAHEAGVQIVTGDTKVVGRGAADGVFINTTGVGVHPLALGPALLRPGDVLLINGTVGDHGVAVMTRREGLAFDAPLRSDCAPLNGLIASLLAACPGAVHCMRDPTRGGLAATLNEWALASGLGIEVREAAIPINEAVRGVCELLGFDPLYVANEGKVVIAVDPTAAETALTALRAHPLGRDAAIIGRVNEAHAGRVVLQTPFGAGRLLTMPSGELLPRIC